MRVRCAAPEQVQHVHAIGEQSAGPDELGIRIDCWDAVSLTDERE